MKSGTTSLHSYLAQHPDIFMCEPKEPWYFVKEINWYKGQAWYLSLFENAGKAKIVGESSTDYTKIPKYLGVPERIFDFNPKAHFIYIMRDPIERTISHYWHNVRWHGERRDMLTAIYNEPHFLDVSNYSMQLTPYINLFGRDKIYTLTFEEMTVNRVHSISKIFSWLDINAAFTPHNINEEKNVTPKRINQVKGFGILHFFRQTRLWDEIYTYFPKDIRRIAQRLAYKPIDRDAESIANVINYLRPIQLQQTKLLTAMLGKEFPEWTTLYQKDF